MFGSLGSFYGIFTLKHTDSTADTTLNARSPPQATNLDQRESAYAQQLNDRHPNVECGLTSRPLEVRILHPAVRWAPLEPPHHKTYLCIIDELLETKFQRWVL